MTWFISQPNSAKEPDTPQPYHAAMSNTVKGSNEVVSDSPFGDAIGFALGLAGTPLMWMLAFLISGNGGLIASIIAVAFAVAAFLFTIGMAEEIRVLARDRRLPKLRVTRRRVYHYYETVTNPETGKSRVVRRESYS